MRDITIFFFFVCMPHLSVSIYAYAICGSVLSKFFGIAKCKLKFSDCVPKAKQLFL